MKLQGFVAAAALVALGTGAVIAQSDAIAARQKLMKDNNDGARVLVAMMRGNEPYDASKVDPVFSQWSHTAETLPGLFPDNSRTGEDTRASPKIWQNKADFDAKAAAFGKAVADNHDRAKQSLDGLKAAVAAVGQACDNCHELYRLSRR